MHDGQNLFEAYAGDSFSGTSWSVDGALDRGSLDGSIREAIVAGIGNTLMIGSSLGGLVTGCAGLWDATTFGGVGVVSPSTWWASEWITAQVAASKNQSVKPSRVYVYSGNAGRAVTTSPTRKR
jgi:predicted alpha/beta superfamily hydrolase